MTGDREGEKVARRLLQTGFKTLGCFQWGGVLQPDQRPGSRYSVRYWLPLRFLYVLAQVQTFAI